MTTEKQPVVMFNESEPDQAEKPKTPADYYREFLSARQAPLPDKGQQGAPSETRAPKG